MVRTLHGHPDMTAGELGELMGLTAESIRCARKRYGRFITGPVCGMCNERPVWATSPMAKRYGLCHACYIEEMRRQAEEAREDAAMRTFRARTKKGARPYRREK